MADAANPVLQAIRERRSIRRFTDEPVSRDEVLQVLEAGRWAPSGLNNQPCRFVVLMPGDGRIERICECTRYAAIARSARALVVVSLDKESMYNGMKDHQGAGACIQNMLLAAHALGLGAVWLGEIVNRGHEVLERLGLDPARYELMAVIAMGRPAAVGKSSRKPLTELLLEEF